MRVCSYNLENLFLRARILNRNDWVHSDEEDPNRLNSARITLNMVSKLNSLIAKPIYDDQTKAEIVELIFDLGLNESDESPYVLLRRNRGAFLTRPKTGNNVQIIANGRDDWIGWVELKNEAVSEVATLNTARVIANVNPDIMGVIEAESRISLNRFNSQILPKVGGTKFEHIMLIDGNDERGIDVGIMLKSGISIRHMVSHVDDLNENGRTVFCRDCAEYHLELPNGKQLIILINHFKSKGYGKKVESDLRRFNEAKRVRQIYDGLINSGHENIIVMGDLNDTPDSDPLAPLFKGVNALRDVSEHANFQNDGRPGTYGNGTKSGKIDYILLSPVLFDLVESGGIYRKGVWGGKNGDLWPRLEELQNANQAASDHAALFADLNL